HGVNPIQNATVTGQESSGVFDPSSPFQGRLNQVSQLSGNVHAKAKYGSQPPDHGIDSRIGIKHTLRRKRIQPHQNVADRMQVPEEEDGDDRGANRRGDCALPGFFGTNALGHFVFAERPAEIVGKYVTGPDDDEKDEDQDTAVVSVPDQ